jgi:excisionase family DNA binding protein
MTKEQRTNDGFPLTLSVAETAYILDVVPATVYQWVRDDEVPSLHFGSRVRVPTAKLADLLGVTPMDLAAQIEPQASAET